MASKKKYSQSSYLLEKGDNKFTFKGQDVEQGAFFAGYAAEKTRSLPAFNSAVYSGSFPIYAFLFNLYDSGEPTNFDLIPFDIVAGKVNDYVRSMTGDFFEETFNLAWLEVNSMFFHHLFLNDFIYVEYIEEDEKYCLYYKIRDIKPDKDEDLKDGGWFLDIMTNEKTWFEDPDADLIRVSWNGVPDNRFLKWFRLAYDMEAKARIIDKQLFLWNKKISLDLVNNPHVSALDIELLQKELLNMSVTIHKRDSGFINFLPPTVTPAEIQIAQAIMYQRFDREAGNMGLVANLNPKQERLIVAETFMAMDKQIDELRRRLNQLVLMCKRMEEKGWPALNFITNTAENIGLVAPEPAEEQPQAEEQKETKEPPKSENV